MPSTTPGRWRIARRPDAAAARLLAHAPATPSASPIKTGASATNDHRAMQTSTDTFLGFVDVLASALDDDAGELRATDAGVTDLEAGDSRRWVAEAA